MIPVALDHKDSLDRMAFCCLVLLGVLGSTDDEDRMAFYWSVLQASLDCKDEDL
jgi:hypothetical protein